MPPKKKKVKIALPRVPTSEELTDVRETQHLFKSHLFKLQMEELLKEVSLKQDKLSCYESFLKQLKVVFQDMPKRQVLMPADKCPLTCWPKPFNKLHPSSKLWLCLPPHARSHVSVRQDKQQAVSLPFAPPARIDLVGSYLLETMSKPDGGHCVYVDVALQLPADTVFDKDYRNYRYLEKRALYLQAIYRELRKHQRYSDVELGWFRGDALKPILLLKAPSPSDSGSSKPLSLVVRLLPCLSPDRFPHHKLGPDSSCCLPVLWPPPAQASSSSSSSSDYSSASSSSSSPSPSAVSPLYNSRVLEDLCFPAHLQRLFGLTRVCASFGPALQLLKVWFSQRFGSSSSSSSWSSCLLPESTFNGFLLAMVLAYLLQPSQTSNNKFSSSSSSQTANTHMSPYQLFRAALRFLASEKLSEGVALRSSSTEAGTAVVLASARHFPCSLLDGWLNLTARVSQAHLAELTREAKCSLQEIDNVHQDGFESVFMTRQQLALKCDAWLMVSVPLFGSKLVEECALLYSGPHFASAASASAPLAFAAQLYELLRQGLTNRVQHLFLRLATERSKGRKSQQQNQQQKHSEVLCVTVGLVYDGDAAEGGPLRHLDLGPAPDVDRPAALAFRRLWGPLAQLRRFKDGRMLESVQWPDSQEPVPLAICRHLLARHCQLSVGPDQQVLFSSGQTLTSTLLLRPSPDADRSLEPCTKSLPALRKALETLGDACRNCKEVPLKIISAVAAHPAIYGGAVFPPQPLSPPYSLSLADAVEPIEVVLKFETSNKWPDDLRAIARIKTAFYLRLGDALKQQYGLVVWVGLGCVDVMVDGFAFRLRICQQRELLVLKADLAEGRPLPPKGLLGMLPGDLEWVLVHRPWLTSTLSGVQAQYPLFGPSCRLVKRWLAAHLLLDTALPACAADLLVASLFLTGGQCGSVGGGPPGSPLAALLRFVWRLGHWDWQNQPLILDLTEDLSTAQLNALSDEFKLQRAGGKGVAMCISCVYDPSGHLWTGRGPSVAQLFMLQAYAKSTYLLLQDLLPQGDQAPGWLSVLKTPLSHYHAFLVLRPRALPNQLRCQALFLTEEDHDEEQEQIEEEEKAPQSLLAALLPKELAVPDTSDITRTTKDGYKLPPTKQSMQAMALQAKVRAARPPLVGFNAQQLFLQELQTQFSSHVEAYSDVLGGTLIALRWRAGSCSTEQSNIRWNVSRSLYAKPIFNKAGRITGLVADHASLLADMTALGDGLVVAIFSDYQTLHQHLPIY
eukprot:gb/GEZN01000713.1/.p1 GENE.gb/GEZN01000713.1/~~gb/GEZN01000713.1/.p1  ORF type:complete len:1247 (-),score=274.37 gb/GEZN01000713.1/:10-3750(-)